MQRFSVEYSGGPSRYGNKGVDYMLVCCLNRAGEEVELYDEFVIDGAVDDLGRPLFVDGDWNKEFDAETYSYDILRKSILEQADKSDVDPDTLAFFYDQE